MNSGAHKLTMAEYLKLPAVSHSILQAIIEECPRAAWWASWLNPDRELEESTETDRGTVAHQILLEGSEAGVAVIDPIDHPSEKGGGIPAGWTNKSIRAARDRAREAGQIPVLAPQMMEIRQMVVAARAFVAGLEKSEPAIWAAFQPGHGDSELTLLWEDGPTLCRERPDRISADRRLIINYKTTATSVEPDRWGRTQMIGAGHYIGAAWYRRGVRALFDVEPDHVYLCQEAKPPYLCSLVGVAPAAFQLGEQKCAAALRVWQQCVERGFWPEYPARVVYPEIPVWEFQQWEERQANDPTIAYGSQP